MKRSLLDILACPKCQAEFGCTPDAESGEIVEGVLRCRGCAASYAIHDGIPRFVADEGHYAGSFGLQWNRFRTTQLDSVSGARLSWERFFNETGWDPDWLAGKLILDAGCGAGRFVEIAAECGAHVVGVDLSSAVLAAAVNAARFPHAHIVQASLYELPFRPDAFDGCYCIGVLQHTPEPARALASLPAVVKAGGRIAVVAYERKRWTKLHSKYLIRPLTTRMPKTALLRAIRWLMPLLFTASELLFRVPVFGRVFRFMIPVANYTGERRLSFRQRYEWAILDTFDMLSPKFDQPQTAAEVVSGLTAAGVVDLRRRPSAGLIVVGTRGGP